MNIESFISTVLTPNIVLYFLLLLFSIVIYYFVYRKFVVSLLDPLVLSALFSLFGCSVVLLLFVTDNIQSDYFVSYIFTQILFWTGFRLFGKKHMRLSNKSFKVKNENSLFKYVYISSLLIYVSVTLLSYKILGIPVFQNSRLDINANAQGGMGILSRFSDIACVLSLYCMIHYWSKLNKKMDIKIMQIGTIIFFFLFSILSGSKSSFMLLATVLFSYAIINRNENMKVYLFLKKNEYKLICMGVIGVFVTLSLNYGNLETIFFSFLYRLIGSGDIYWLAYPGGLIETLDGSRPFITLFQSFFGFFRLVPHSDFPEPLGYTLSSYFYLSNGLTGANARHNIFGYVYFGSVGCYLFSFILGSYIGVIRSLFFSASTHGLFYKVLLVLLYVDLFSLETDPTLYIIHLNNLLIVLPVILLISLANYFLISNYYKICHL